MKRRVGRFGMVCVGLLAAFAIGACGGSDKKDAEEPVTADDDEPAVDPGPTSVPQAKLDEVQRYLDRQRKFIARCWGDALEADEVPGSDDGSITLKFVVQPSGKVADLEVTQISHKSQVLESCVREKAARWQMTTLEKSLPYSFTFGFQRL